MSRDHLLKTLTKLLARADATSTSSVPSAIDDVFLTAAREDARIYADLLVQTLGSLGAASDRDAGSYAMECAARLVEAAFALGRHGGLADGARSFVARERAEEARQVLGKSASKKNEHLAEAIQQEAVARGLTLSASEKFASIIEDGVRARLNVKEDDRGYSRRVIQRQISAILKGREPS